MNIFAFNKDIKLLESCIEQIKDAEPDSLIMSDLGIINLVRRYMPDTPLHVSTQTSTLNYEAVKFWQDYGATRVILGREVNISDMAEIKQKVPNIELEVFVHGAQCVSFSGRCLISDYMTDGERKANQGNCCQPCRWSYKLVEETRPGQYYEIEQNERGTHIMSTKDLCLVNHLSKLIDAGVDSLKVEGRTKSLYYVSAVAKTYRNAIDTVYENRNADMTPFFNELLKVGNRGYTTGFYLGDGEYPNDGYSYDISKGLAGADFLCEIHDKVDDYYKIKTKNKFYINNDVELISPSEQFVTRAIGMKDLSGEQKEFANTNDELLVKFDKEIVDYKYGIVRTVGIKEYEN